MGIRKRYFNEYAKNAKSRNIDFNLTFQEFNQIIVLSCHYCGSEPIEHNRWIKIQHKAQPSLKHNGIDRINSNIGYVFTNVVACCSKCNLMKNIFPEEDFLNHVKKIYLHNEKSSTTIPSGSTSQANGDGKRVSPEKGE